MGDPIAELGVQQVEEDVSDVVCDDALAKQHVDDEEVDVMNDPAGFLGVSGEQRPGVFQDDLGFDDVVVVVIRPDVRRQAPR